MSVRKYRTIRKSLLNQLYVPKKVIPTVPKKEPFIILPCLRTMSSTLKGKLWLCFRNSLPQCKIKLIIESANRPHIVYNLFCNICNVIYYRKTGRNLNVRCGEHVGISHVSGKGIESKPFAVLDHLLMHNHGSDFNDFTTLCRL